MSKNFDNPPVGKDYGDWGGMENPYRIHVPDSPINTDCWMCMLAGITNRAEYVVPGARVCYDHLLAAGYTPTHSRVRRA